MRAITVWRLTGASVLALGLILSGCNKGEGGGDKDKADEGCKGAGWMKCLGEALGHLQKKDGKAALPILLEVCEGEPKQGEKGLKSVVACTQAAHLLRKGEEGVDKDVKKAAGLYTKACDNKDKDACKIAGFAHSLGNLSEDEKPQVKLAAEFFKKACDLGDDDACAKAKRMEEEAKKGDPKDWPKMCDDGDANACAEAGFAHVKGRKGYAKDPKKGFEFMTKACDKGYGTACGFVGKMLEKGEAGEKDPKKAMEAYKKGCTLKSGISCRKVGMMAIKAQDFKGAFPWMEKACDLDGDCAFVGMMYENGRGVAKDPAKARAAYKKGCDKKDEGSCKQLAKMKK